MLFVVRGCDVWTRATNTRARACIHVNQHIVPMHAQSYCAVLQFRIAAKNNAQLCVFFFFFFLATKTIIFFSSAVNAPSSNCHLSGVAISDKCVSGGKSNNCGVYRNSATVWLRSRKCSSTNVELDATNLTPGHQNTRSIANKRSNANVIVDPMSRRVRGPKAPQLFHSKTAQTPYCMQMQWIKIKQLTDLNQNDNQNFPLCCPMQALILFCFNALYTLHLHWLWLLHWSIVKQKWSEEQVSLSKCAGNSNTFVQYAIDFFNLKCDHDRKSWNWKL